MEDQSRFIWQPMFSLKCKGISSMHMLHMKEKSLVSLNSTIMGNSKSILSTPTSKVKEVKYVMNLLEKQNTVKKQRRLVEIGLTFFRLENKGY